MPDFDDPNDEEKQEKLAEDGDTPYSAPSDINTHGKLSPDAPQRDEPEDGEAYSEGENAAAGLQEDEGPDDEHGVRIG